MPFCLKKRKEVEKKTFLLIRRGHYSQLAYGVPKKMVLNCIDFIIKILKIPWRIYILVIKSKVITLLLRQITTFVLCSQRPLNLHHFCWTRFQIEGWLELIGTPLAVDYKLKICFHLFQNMWKTGLVRRLILLQTHKCSLLIMGLHIFEIKLC